MSLPETRGKVQVQIYNLNSEMLFDKAFENVQGEILLNTSGYAPSVYLVKVSTNEKSKVIKMIVQ